jgi:hypothetical protein
MVEEPGNFRMEKRQVVSTVMSDNRQSAPDKQNRYFRFLRKYLIDPKAWQVFLYPAGT